MHNMSSSTTTATKGFVQTCIVALIACLVASWQFFNANNIAANPGDKDSKQNIIQKDVVHAISGAIGSALSISLLYPLETIRTRLQVAVVDDSNSSQSSFGLIYNIGKKEGLVNGLYRGWFSLVVALMMLNFVYFYCFQVSRRWITDHYDISKKVIVDLFAGYAAGCFAVLVTGPLWLVNTRLKLQGVNIGQEKKEDGGDNSRNNQQYAGIIDCLYRITKEEGVLTLWNGTLTSIILSLNPAIQLGVYEMLKRHHLVISIGLNANNDDDSQGGSSTLEPFLNALIAKFISTVITYPIQVIQTRHRAGVSTKKEEKRSTTTSLKKSYYGILLGLYCGLESKLLQTCLNSALMFVAYERLVDILTALLLLSNSNDNYNSN